jgi:hypothetical protein
MEVVTLTEIGWTPDDIAVQRSEIESKVADIIEDDSLEVIDEMSGTEGVNPDLAAQSRLMRGDLRLDTTDVEQQAALVRNEVMTWVIVGLGLLLAAGGLLLTGIPFLFI